MSAAPSPRCLRPLPPPGNVQHVRWCLQSPPPVRPFGRSPPTRRGFPAGVSSSSLDSSIPSEDSPKMNLCWQVESPGRPASAPCGRTPPPCSARQRSQHPNLSNITSTCTSPTCRSPTCRSVKPCSGRPPTSISPPCKSLPPSKNCPPSKINASKSVQWKSYKNFPSKSQQCQQSHRKSSPIRNIPPILRRSSTSCSSSPCLSPSAALPCPLPPVASFPPMTSTSPSRGTAPPRIRIKPARTKPTRNTPHGSTSPCSTTPCTPPCTSLSPFCSQSPCSMQLCSTSSPCSPPCVRSPKAPRSSSPGTPPSRSPQRSTTPTRSPPSHSSPPRSTPPRSLTPPRTTCITPPRCLTPPRTPSSHATPPRCASPPRSPRSLTPPRQTPPRQSPSRHTPPSHTPPCHTPSSHTPPCLTPQRSPSPISTPPCPSPQCSPPPTPPPLSPSPCSSPSHTMVPCTVALPCTVVPRLVGNCNVPPHPSSPSPSSPPACSPQPPSSPPQTCSAPQSISPTACSSPPASCEPSPGELSRKEDAPNQSQSCLMVVRRRSATRRLKPPPSTWRQGVHFEQQHELSAIMEMESSRLFMPPSKSASPSPPSRQVSAPRWTPPKRTTGRSPVRSPVRNTVATRGSGRRPAPVVVFTTMAATGAKPTGPKENLHELLVATHAAAHRNHPWVPRHLRHPLHQSCEEGTRPPCSPPQLPACEESSRDQSPPSSHSPPCHSPPFSFSPSFSNSSPFNHSPPCSRSPPFPQQSSCGPQSLCGQQPPPCTLPPPPCALPPPSGQSPPRAQSLPSMPPPPRAHSFPCVQPDTCGPCAGRGQQGSPFPMPVACPSFRSSPGSSSPSPVTVPSLPCSPHRSPRRCSDEEPDIVDELIRRGVMTSPFSWMKRERSPGSRSPRNVSPCNVSPRDESPCDRSRRESSPCEKLSSDKCHFSPCSPFPPSPCPLTRSPVRCPPSSPPGSQPPCPPQIPVIQCGVVGNIPDLSATRGFACRESQRECRTLRFTEGIGPCGQMRLRVRSPRRHLDVSGCSSSSDFWSETPRRRRRRRSRDVSRDSRGRLRAGADAPSAVTDGAEDTEALQLLADELLCDDVSASGDGEDLEAMFNRLGLGWAAAMLRKTQEVMAISSSSSEASRIALGHASSDSTLPVGGRGRSTPAEGNLVADATDSGAPAFAFTGDSDLSSVGGAPLSSRELSTPNVSLVLKPRASHRQLS